MRRKDIDKKKSDGAEKWGAVALSVLCVGVLCFTCADSERYGTEGEDVAVSGITFTPPERVEPPGLWDIVSEAVKGLFFAE